MNRTPVLRAAGVVLALSLGLAGCSGGGDGASGPSGSATPTPSASASASASSSAPVVAAPARPRDRACYRLAYDAAVAPTTDSKAVPCAKTHTSMTYAVGDLDTLVDGHLLAVDSARVRDQVAATCPEKFATFVGGTTDDRRLSMLRPVWFTPTVEDSDAGASWYRCDVVALAGKDTLAPLTGQVRGTLGRADGRARYAMCGTAAPGSSGFERVLCTANHSWRAVSIVDLGGGAYPGQEKVRSAGDSPCQDAGSQAANGALDYKWGYEWPTRQQWAGGQHYGICWAPA